MMAPPNEEPDMPCVLSLDVPLQRARPDFGSVDVAAHVDGDAFGGARAHGVLDRIRNKGDHFAVVHAADSDAPLPVGAIARHAAGFRVGDVEHVRLVDVDAARPAELAPFRDEVALLIEDLNAVVAAIPDEEAAARI